MTERTFSIIKPDATRRNLTGAINAKLEAAGLRIIAQKRIHLTLAQAQAFFARFGWPSLLLAWLPVVGDPLTFVAGTLNYPFGRFVTLVFIGKAGRYAALWAGWAGLA